VQTRRTPSRPLTAGRVYFELRQLRQPRSIIFTFVTF
jgi:hypothetical protein